MFFEEHNSSFIFHLDVNKMVMYYNIIIYNNFHIYVWRHIYGYMYLEPSITANNQKTCFIKR